MFIGRYYHTLESGGRVSLPKIFRDQETDWIITRGLDGGLFAFRAEQFNQELTKLTQRTFTRKDHRDFARLLANEARHTSVDKNGRVQLPEYLISFANLSKEVVIVGSGTYLEIWDQTRYHQYLDLLETSAEQIAERLDEPTH